MTRLSDRAYQTLKTEVEQHYTSYSNGKFSQEQHLEQMILLARLDTLHHKSGRAMTKAQLWEEVCDILPNIDRHVLNQSSRIDLGSPAVGATIGIGAAGIGAAAVMLSGPLGMGEMAQLTAPSNLFGKAIGKTEIANAKTHYAETFETAKAFGWQAALKGQNPPHSAAHWGETATLWQQAIALLNQIPKSDGYYTAAQQKKTFYQDQLNHIQARQIAAQNTVNAQKPAPQFSRTQPSKTQATKTQAVKSDTVNNQSIQAAAPKASQNDSLTLAKQYGWQAAVAAQNAPHPVEKWAEISKQWQLAIHTLNKIDSQDPQYAEAQKTKEQYVANLAAIRQRYQTEQDADQRLQSLRASLSELEITFSSAKRTQMEAIVARLRTIPAGTVAHQEAQQLISTTTEQIRAIPPAPTKLATFSN
ncbi:MAG: hypothetical protein AAFZ17_04825 [Cyanobacteria bacterium J06650_10]